MKTAQQHLADYKVSMADALAFVTSNLSSPKTIFDTCKAFGVTNAMLAEIIQPSFAGASSADVQAFFNANGFKASLLDSVTFEGHEYLFVNQAMTWANAQAHATSLGGSLAVVNSSAENAFILSQASTAFANYISNQNNSSTLVSNDGGSGAYAWLGGSDIAQEGVWKWVDGSAIRLDQQANSATNAYANWGNNPSLNFSEPDNVNNQDALAMGLMVWPNPSLNAGVVLGVAGQWNDIAETNLMPFVVEIA
jgi:hypothetical protein